MGLKDIAEASTNSNSAERRYKSFGHHPWNSKLDDMVDELQDRFPTEIDCKFVEVSPQMENVKAKAYYRDEGNYIRVAEFLVEDYPEEYVKMTVAHEMCHIYCDQQGHRDVSDGDKLFNWILGMVCADVSGYSPKMDAWKDLAEPMIQHNEEG